MADLLEPTIIAPASALGGGVAVLRVSGPLTTVIITKLTGIENSEPRLMALAEFRNPVTGKPIDKGLSVYFIAPHSFTGEDVAEFHLHGGRAVMDAALKAILSIDPAIRLAEPGEFSKRAVQNGKMDLTEAEAVADLVAAETEAQAEQAVAQLNGALKNRYEEWRAQLVHLLAHMEAAIDFVDEEDVPDDLLRETDQKITALLKSIDAHLDDRSLGERLRDGFTVAVIGAPNAGKSSLVNALAKRDVAIVSSIAGTTRDLIETHLNLGGYPVILVDTAGLRDTDNPIEAEGIARARKRAAHADIVLALFDAAQEKDAGTLAQIDNKTIIVHTKSDLSSTVIPAQAGIHSKSVMNPCLHGDDGLIVSASTGENLDALVNAITDKIKTLAHKKTDAPLLTRARHREHVAETAQHLRRALRNPQPELKTEDIRLAARSLGKLTGRVDVEDLLDVIFSEFCIGK